MILSGIAISGILFVSCQKETVVPLSTNENVISKINNIGVKYKNNGLYKYDKAKAQKLALADAVGAGVGAAGSGGNPWATLWGGFLTTLSLEPHFRQSAGKSSNITNPTNTNSNLFDYQAIGDGHNHLMFEAYSSDIEVDISSGNFNYDLVALIISESPAVNLTAPQSFPNHFATYESGLLTTVSLALSNVNATNDSALHLFVNNSSMEADSKTLINTIINDLDEYDILAGNNFSNYLNDVEETIKASSYSDNVKYQVGVFLSVANSSNYFWRNNFNE